jgi:hypothetical protein
MSIPVHRWPFDVFISHAHCDGAVVRPFVDWLKAAGLQIWFDDREMPGGSLFGLGLHEEIKRSGGLLSSSARALCKVVGYATSAASAGTSRTAQEMHFGWCLSP